MTRAAAASLAQLYVATRLTSEQLNGLVAGLLGTLWTVASGPPASVSDGQAVFGPFTPPLSPATYRLTIVRAEEGRFAFHLDGRPKASKEEDDFVPVLEGAADGGTKRHSGSFSLLLTTRHELDPVATPQTGRIDAAFDFTRETATIALHLQDLAGPGTPPATGDYRFDELADGSGDFRFGVRAGTPDWVAGEGAVRSRWNALGAGRGDADLRGGDGVHRIAECWDASFVRVFLSLDGKAVAGDPGACAFTDALSPDA
jgi:hypothetical protein